MNRVRRRVDAEYGSAGKRVFQQARAAEPVSLEASVVFFKLSPQFGKQLKVFLKGQTEVSLYFLYEPSPTTQLWRPEDIEATVYEALGISAATRIPDQFGRPLAILDHGQTIAGVFGT